MTVCIRRSTLMICLFFVLIIVGCNQNEDEPTLAIPSITSSIAEDKPAETRVEATPSPPKVSRQPESAEDKPVDQSESTAVVTVLPDENDSNDEQGTIFRVAFVEEDDVLNIRSGPGVDNRITGEIDSSEDDIKLLDGERWVEDSLWVKVEVDESSGWVNSQYLTEDIDEDRFCEDRESRQVAQAFVEVIRDRDGESLAELVAEGRGLRIRRHWWNPEVFVSQKDLAGIFTSSEQYDWGRADGTGNDITGSFRMVVLPILDKNLLQATETGCNEILHGGTAGLVKLPQSYEGINLYSFFRPPPKDGIEMDWGTWVVGIEKWHGEYRLSHLIHYEWEI